ncbi:hypothetical protein Clacol_005208 [Clathrus columnatus]|uniref:Glycosyltransferase n=1 Tax=Clathrus columnatus TaxID=1419009 RepID=A0AAV5A8N5_9AGAM|nr:hypothetical protein Clacol_005208 [Clathrus columnatus]
MAFKYHIVFVCAPSWSHCRHSVPISFKIVKERPDVLVTYPVVGKFKERMDREIERYCTGKNRPLKDNISNITLRVVQISEFDGDEVQYWVLTRNLLTEFLQKLCVCEPVTCSTGQAYPAVPKPNLCLVDFALSPLGLDLINDGKVDTPIWCWNAASIFLILYIAGPGYLADEAKDLAQKENKSIREAIIELAASTSDKIINIPGLPPAYVHELRSEHNIAARELWRASVIPVADFIHQSDGLLMANTPILEGGGVNFTKEWLGSKKCYALGPSMLPGDIEFYREEYAGGQDVITFLNKVYDSHGEHSLLYLFAMPHGNTYENALPLELSSKLKSSELSLVAKWTPQQTILNHPVTGIFFTQAGQGSITESLFSGVPMIIWPLQVDQPYNALNLTLNLKVAYQLLEVRIGDGLKPLYRGYEPKGTKEAIDTEFRQVLKDAFGVDGDTKRRVALEISKKLKETWEESGGAMIELRRMLREIFC